MVTVGTLFVVACNRGWIFCQMNVNKTILHGDLHEEVYMQSLQVYSKQRKNKICKLQKYTNHQEIVFKAYQRLGEI